MTTETILSFYPLTLVSDAPDIIVGRKDINSYAAFPEDGAELLKQLQAGKSLEEATEWYQKRYKKRIDIADFLETLYELQFIRTASEEEDMPIAPARSAAAWQWVGRALFSPLAWIFYAGVVGYCLFLLLRSPYLVPNYRDIFFSPFLVVMEVGFFFGQMPGILFHELYHTLAGKRLGISSRLGIGRRLYFLVFETHLDGLWSVPRKARYLPFLAGMLADTIWFCFLTILASLTYIPSNPYTFPGAFFLALAYSTALRFIWQCYFYLETDIYYVITNAFRCVDLQQTTRQYLLNRLYRLLRLSQKIRDEEIWHPRDRQVARWYVFVFCAGYAFSLGTFVLVGIPTAYRIFSGVFTRLIIRRSLDAGFWDSGAFLFLNGLQIVVMAVLFLREHRANRKKKRVTQAVKRDVA